MIDVRTVFEKKGRAKYISHLDLNRFMMRAFRRSELPIWYTEGFNPHPYATFALALSLGFESEYEIMDFSLTEGVSFGKVKKILNEILPEGLKIVYVMTPEHSIKDIEKSEFSVEYLTEFPDRLSDEMKRFLERDEITVEKKTKKGMKSIDIKPDVEVYDIHKIDDGKLVFNIKLPAGTQTNLNPALFIQAFSEFSDVKFETGRICRTKILCTNGELFK